MSFLRLLLVFVFVILLSGCASPGVAPKDSFYRMSDPEAVTPAGAMLDGILVVPRFLADGLANERPLVYVQANALQVLRQYNFHFWSEPPTRLIQERTVEYLRWAKIAPMVVTPEFRAAADYQLTGKIKRLEQVRGPSPRAVVSIEFGLYRVRDNRLLYLETYVQEVPLDGDDIGRAAAAMGSAVMTILSRLTEDLSRL